MPRYSPSKLSTYRDCPLKYRFSAIDRIRKPDTVEQFVGSMVHDTLEEVVDVRRRFSKELTFEEAARIYEARFDEKWDDDIVISKDYLTAEDYKRQGLENIRNFFALEAGREPWEVVDLEKGVVFPLGECEINGFIDRLERSGSDFRVIDYKTGAYVIPQEKADADWQLGIYELAVREEFPEADDISLEWFFLGPCEVVSSFRDEGARQALREEIQALVSRIESDTEFLPLGTNWCPCEYEEECLAEKEKRRIRASGGGPSLDEKVDRYAELCDRQAALKQQGRALEAEMADIEDDLVDFTRKTDAWSIEGRTRALDVKRRKDFYIPKKGTPERASLDELVRESGCWQQVSDVSKKALVDAALKGRLGAAADDVMTLLEERETFTFKPTAK